MSDTPRTDLNYLTVETLRTMKGTGTKIVLASVARQLERELNAANDRIKRLEEESESRWRLAQSAIGSCAEMSSRIKRLEEAGNAVAFWFSPMAKHQLTTSHLAALNQWKAAKETK